VKIGGVSEACVQCGYDLMTGINLGSLAQAAKAADFARHRPFGTAVFKERIRPNRGLLKVFGDNKISSEAVCLLRKTGRSGIEMKANWSLGIALVRWCQPYPGRS